MGDFYSVLGCKKDASYEEIKKKYQELVLKCHPDKQNAHTNVDVVDVNEAWKTLRDPESRAKYNSSLLHSYCAAHRLLFAAVDISELRWCADKQLFSYDCKCGGSYTIYQDMLSSCEVIVNCDECSLCIEVKTPKS
ncbi:hypothetical protein PR048_000317 [Dryococelus australis]|uniref:Uncharacterized protein n=1 Tax=Dryococelus australis TaxID=614101 RepID=A0ABQ9IEA5_9NEOP|nr:hypothetical protein PR048_000317 [Dryococelus australis]